MTDRRHKEEVQFMIETLTTELAKLIIEERSISISEALEIIFQSHTFEKVEDENTGLYYQSPVYIHDMLNEEIGFDFSPAPCVAAEDTLDLSK